MTNRTPIQATQVPENKAKSLYPEPFASLVKHRTRRRLGDHFGLANLGVNLTTLAPGAISALKHHHSKQDEFIYVLSGTPMLRYGEVEAVYLELGDRLAGDTVQYPDDDLALIQGADGAWVASHKDGPPY
ncbi:cupin domain-containing protein [Aeromonas mytilicola]|uniref:cupin domain-containing protein n=1 Tax=Aeromonas media TaxID=651 RepID=UPI001F20DD0E|nr:cupin domain-containing protein [Aeromonas media]MCE9924917.1 cupin domain-containing protein [Aeromonas media]